MLKASSNGRNSDGTSMNVGNKLSDRPSIRLLGAKYNSGDAIKALLFSDEPDPLPQPQTRRGPFPQQSQHQSQAAVSSSANRAFGGYTNSTSHPDHGRGGLWQESGRAAPQYQQPFEDGWGRSVAAAAPPVRVVRAVDHDLAQKSPPVPTLRNKQHNGHAESHNIDFDAEFDHDSPEQGRTTPPPQRKPYPSAPVAQPSSSEKSNHATPQKGAGSGSSQSTPQKSGGHHVDRRFEKQLQPCEFCGRSFMPGSLKIHIPTCKPKFNKVL